MRALKFSLKETTWFWGRLFLPCTGVLILTTDHCQHNILNSDPPTSLCRLCKTIAYVVHSDHLTSDNFSACVRCVRHLSEVACSRAALDHVLLQLLDLLDALYSKVGEIFHPASLQTWSVTWCPLLQG